MWFVMRPRFAVTERLNTLINLDETIIKIQAQDASNRLNIIISI